MNQKSKKKSLQKNLPKPNLKKLRNVDPFNPILGEFGDNEEVNDDLLITAFTGAHGLCGVYVIKCNEYYKIGHSINFAHRLDNFRNANPYPIEVVLFLVTDYYREIEGQIHQLLDEKRVYREWFLLENKDILTIVKFLEDTWKKLLKQKKEK
jgi:hypothetical protein